MPADEYQWLPKQNLLTFEEISTLTDVFMSVGVDKVRLTVPCGSATLRSWSRHPPHTGPEAFHAGRLCIDLLKQETPIWKKEYSPGGEEWIGLRP